MDIARYSRQVLFEPLGEKGQLRLRNSSVLIVGCGALGTVVAGSLVRAGIGGISIIDRDFVEMDNLQRQIIFDEDDARGMLPKALAAERHLKKVNSSVEIKGEVLDVNAGNIQTLMEGIDLVMDATDNLETRLLINDACVKAGVPWIHGAALGSYGMEMPIIPGETACYRCYLGRPSPERLPGCDVIGVLNPVTGIVACLQSAHALRILAGGYPPRSRMIFIDVWEDLFLEMEIRRSPDCACCARRDFQYLRPDTQSVAVSLCGRDAVQVTPPGLRDMDMKELARDLSRVGKVEDNGFLLDFKCGDAELVIFPDGRAIIKGARDVAHARSLYSRFVGT